MPNGIFFTILAGNRQQLRAIVTDPKSAQKYV